MKGFLMSLEVAQKFFERCVEKEAVTLAERNKVMLDLLHEENIKIVKEAEVQKLLKEKKVIKISGRAKK